MAMPTQLTNKFIYINAYNGILFVKLNKVSVHTNN